ncbi:hypothetical protein FE810_10910 [Thalassotalea litorea]|uniref:Letm1 RBD domain-containing protein n=1 Tax=Thalassotalea litorea TaxID=2020715 RepID=A0A5R9IGF1_9GAMM|nr:hypothetical protein [Thalassotalea litorea]TLU64595.1 hypothetical protein FE810_10910 [Thalassotalea litorea]
MFKARNFVLRAPVRTIKIKRKRSSVSLKRQMLLLKVALHQEKDETREMLIIYRQYTKGQASKQQLAQANEQFLDVLKGIGLGVFAVMPFAPITIPVVIKVGQWVGVDILPSSFSDLKTRRR